MHPASLLAGVQHFRGARTQAFVIIGHDKLNAAQAADCQGSEEVLPEGLCFGFAGGKAADFALAFGSGPDSHYRSRRDDPSALTAFDVRRFDPQVGPLTPSDVHRTSGNLLRWSKFLGINPSKGRFRKA